ncbi:MAG: FAD-dependent oxidoreductase [Caldilineaceae bacterium]|nr:FAD-dependent oxidoreductase [Caldilineaceae bacterium]
MDAPFVIIGGDAAGMSAASKIKREQPDTTVIVFERSPYISYSACGMPYWIGGVVESDRDLIVLTPQVARRKRGIDVRIHHEVTAIDPAQHLVHGVNHETGQAFSQPYAKLCIATGARAVLPPIPGAELPGVFTLRALTDAQRIYAYLQEHPTSTAVVIGAGYIGIEMVEALHAREIEVHLIEMLPQIMPNFDAEMVTPIATHLTEQDVKLYTGTRVEAIAAQEGQLAVQTDKTAVIHAGIVIVSVGVRPNAELAAEAGLRLGESGAIWVDRHMRTSAADIFAAGDCVEHHHLVLERNAWIPLATSANKGGRIAGESMIGEDASLPGILGTAIVKAFDYTMASTGLTEQEARESGLFGVDGEFVGSAIIENSDRARYWPGSETLTVKLVFDKRGGRILGGQLVGKAGVNKRIDIIATAITAKMTLKEVELLDLSYAPPYSTTHDPIQICASVGQRELIRQPI